MLLEGLAQRHLEMVGDGPDGAHLRDLNRAEEPLERTSEHTEPIGEDPQDERIIQRSGEARGVRGQFLRR